MGLNRNGMDAKSGIVYDPEGRNTVEEPVPHYYYEPLVNLVVVIIILISIAVIIYVKKFNNNSKTEQIERNIEAGEYSGKFNEKLGR